MKMAHFVFIVVQLFAINIFADWQKSKIEKSSVYTYIPKSNNGPRVLMLALHGCNQKNKDMVKHGNWAQVAEDNNMIVVAPNAPRRGRLFRCWNYFGKKSIKKTHAQFLNNLLEKYINDKKLNIDKNQVFISGFSSGGAMAMVMACFRPDLIAGIGAASAPSLSSKYYESTFPGTDVESALKVCKSYSNNSKHLKNLIGSFIHGDKDLFVNKSYNKINAEMFNLLLDQDLEKSEFKLSDISNRYNKGKGYLWSDGLGSRVSLIENDGIGHNWPSGSHKEVASLHIKGKSINYPKYLTEFLIDNNLRLEKEFIFKNY